MNNNELTQKKSAGDAGTSTDTVNQDTNIIPQNIEKINTKFDLVDFGIALKRIIQDEVGEIRTEDACDYTRHYNDDHNDDHKELVYKFLNSKLIIRVSVSVASKEDE